MTFSSADYCWLRFFRRVTSLSLLASAGLAGAPQLAFPGAEGYGRFAVGGLNPNDPSDRNQIAPDGYTQLEHYLNSLVVL